MCEVYQHAISDVEKKGLELNQQFINLKQFVRGGP